MITHILLFALMLAVVLLAGREVRHIRERRAITAEREHLRRTVAAVNALVQRRLVAVEHDLAAQPGLPPVEREDDESTVKQGRAPR